MIVLVGTHVCAYVVVVVVFFQYIYYVVYSKVKLTFIYIASKGQGVWICFSLKATPVVSKKDLCWTEWRSVPG